MTELSLGDHRDLHFDVQPTIPAVTRILSLLDYLYMTELLQSRPELFFERDLHPSDLHKFVHPAKMLMDSKSGKEAHAREDMNYVVAMYKEIGDLSIDDQLQIVLLRRTTSFDVSLDGIGVAVEKVMESLDPLSRERRREELRHLKEMNEHEEMKARREHLSDSVKTMIDTYQRLVDVGVMSKAEMVESIRIAITAEGLAVAALEKASQPLELQNPTS